MGSRRTARVAEAIREVVSSTILFELRDPRVQDVTVIGVDVPEDLRSAKVRISVMGDPSRQRLSLQGLNAARGFLQGRVAERVNLRFTPLLRFEIDEGVKKSAEASRILRQLAAEREAAEAAGRSDAEISGGSPPQGAGSDEADAHSARAVEDGLADDALRDDSG